MTNEITETSASSRRRFLATSAGVGAGVWAAPAVLGAATASAAVSDVPDVCTPAVLLFDDFDTENGGQGTTNYNGFANFDVVNHPTETVDIIGKVGANPAFFDLIPGNGLYVDLDGSSNNAGKLRTKTAFDFKGGCSYELRYRLAGNRRGGSDTVTVRVDGGMANNVHVLASGDGPTDFVLAFTPPADLSSTVSFEDSGADNVGALLLTVELVCL